MVCSPHPSLSWVTGGRHFGGASGARGQGLYWQARGQEPGLGVAATGGWGDGHGGGEAQVEREKDLPPSPDIGTPPSSSYSLHPLHPLPWLDAAPP